MQIRIELILGGLRCHWYEDIGSTAFLNIVPERGESDCLLLRVGLRAAVASFMQDAD
jgi:hypothetical protein